MSSTSLLFILLALSTCGYYVGRSRAFAVAGNAANIKNLHSRPTYYGFLAALWCGIPTLLLFGFWLAFESSIITHLVVADLSAGEGAAEAVEIRSESGMYFL